MSDYSPIFHPMFRSVGQWDANFRLPTDSSHIKPASHCPILKSLMALVLTNVIGCNSCLLRSHPIFRSQYPTDRIRFLLYLSYNAFRAMIEMNNRMRSIWSSLTCQSPSDSIRFFRITSDRPIVHSHCPIFPLIFHPIRQTIK